MRKSRKPIPPDLVASLTRVLGLVSDARVLDVAIFRALEQHSMTLATASSMDEEEKVKVRKTLDDVAAILEKHVELLTGLDKALAAL